MSGFDHFGILAPFYERVIPLKKPERIKEVVDLPNGGFLLDVGGGTGRVAKEFTHKGSLVVVADESMGMLRQARQIIHLSPVNLKSEILPFSGNFFDRVIMIDALHHVINQEETITELWRVLKIGGKLIIEEPDIRRFSVKLVALMEKIALMRSHFLSPPAIANHICQLGGSPEIISNGFSSWVIAVKTEIFY